MKKKFDTDEFSSNYRNSIGHKFNDVSNSFDSGGVVLKLRYDKKKFNLVKGSNLNMIIHPYIASVGSNLHPNFSQCFRIEKVFEQND